MADIHWAIEQLDTGKKIRRSIWLDPSDHIYLDCYMIRRYHTVEGILYESFKSILMTERQTDWELYEPKMSDTELRINMINLQRLARARKEAIQIVNTKQRNDPLKTNGIYWTDELIAALQAAEKALDNLAKLPTIE